MDRSARQKINKKTLALNNTLRADEFNRYIENIPSESIKIHIFFSCTHGTLARIDHMLGHKTSLNKFKNIEIIASIFSNLSDMKVQINYKKKTCKTQGKTKTQRD